jgi:molybdate transport system regulatory protein
MKTSARNRFTGTVSAVRPGAVNDEIDLALDGGPTLSAVITHESTVALGLEPGSAAIALVKAPWVVLVTDADGLRFSARNQFTGVVERVSRGAVNATVTLAVGTITVEAVVTIESLDELGLTEGDTATALFKASHVILAVQG